MTKRKITALFLASLIAVIATGCGQKSFLDNVEETTGTETEVTTTAGKPGRVVTEEELSEIVRNAPNAVYCDDWYCYAVTNARFDDMVTTPEDESFSIPYFYPEYFLARTDTWDYPGQEEFKKNSLKQLMGEDRLNGAYGDDLSYFKFDTEDADERFMALFYTEWWGGNDVGESIATSLETKKPYQWYLDDYYAYYYFITKYVGTEKLLSWNADSKCYESPGSWRPMNYFDAQEWYESVSDTDFKDQFYAISARWLDFRFMGKDIESPYLYREYEGFPTVEEVTAYYEEEDIKIDRYEINSVIPYNITSIVPILQVDYTVYTDSGTAYKGKDVVALRYSVDENENITFDFAYGIIQGDHIGRDYNVSL